MDKIEELPLQIAEFSSEASMVAALVYKQGKGLTNAEELGLRQAKKRQDELFPVIKNNVLAYGTIDAVNIFIKFEDMIKKS